MDFLFLPLTQFLYFTTFLSNFSLFYSIPNCSCSFPLSSSLLLIFPCLLTYFPLLPHALLQLIYSVTLPYSSATLLSPTNSLLTYFCLLTCTQHLLILPNDLLLSFSPRSLSHPLYSSSPPSHPRVVFLSSLLPALPRRDNCGSGVLIS